MFWISINLLLLFDLFLVFSVLKNTFLPSFLASYQSCLKLTEFLQVINCFCAYHLSCASPKKLNLILFCLNQSSPHCPYKCFNACCNNLEFSQSNRSSRRCKLRDLLQGNSFYNQGNWLVKSRIYRVDLQE